MFEYVSKAQEVLSEVNKAVLGKKDEICEIMTAFLANGHVLLEDIPGVGKTTVFQFTDVMRKNLFFRRAVFSQTSFLPMKSTVLLRKPSPLSLR